MIANVSYQPLSKAARQTLISFKVADGKSISKKKDVVTPFLLKADKAGNIAYHECAQNCLTGYEGRLEVGFDPSKVSLLKIKLRPYFDARGELTTLERWAVSPNAI